MASGKNGANGSSGANGSRAPGSPDAPANGDEHAQEPEAVLEPPPPAIAELTAACARFVAQKYKVALDGTPETLSLVDHYVRDARDAVRERPASLDLVAPAVGAYFGELARHAFGAEWFAPRDAAHDAWRLFFTNVYLSFNPIGMAREALTMRDEEGWHAHFEVEPAEREAIDERLAVIPEVDEEEYYLPTTQLDVLTVVVETLRARAEAAGTGDVRFTADDYR